jgi:hypothetical protein
MKIFMLFFMLMPAFANANGFSCKINSVTDVNNSGEFYKDTDWFSLGKVGDVFAVDRITGKIIGNDMLANDTSGIPRITKQSGDNSFIVLTEHQSGDLSVLKIAEHQEIMVFYYVSTFVGQATGICKYL